MAYTFLDLAEDTLKEVNEPLLPYEIWELAKDSEHIKKLRTTGKTPWNSLTAQLYVDVRDNETSRFIKVTNRPAKFFLKSRIAELPSDPTLLKRESKTLTERKRKRVSTYSERDLHKIVTYYAFYNEAFNRGRSVYTKTIFHEKSKKNGYNEWIHPDLVGFYLPISDWNPSVLQLNKISDNNALRLFSFELKKELTKSSYREAFFQSVSNSSWAHEAYLIAAEIDQDPDLLSELERLSMSFGIGIIKLDLEDIDSSSVLFPATQRSFLDWETLNKLCELNTDFDSFVQNVRIDFESKKIHESEYDTIPRDIQEHIRTIRK